MQTITLKSWEEYNPTILGIKTKYGKHIRGKYTTTNRILYRGQADSQWLLNSTLERFSENTWSVKSYCHVAIVCSPQIESFTNKSWDLPNVPQLEEEINKNSDSSRVHIPLPMYSYLVYLRHHGFPSPFLDWSMSSYVASFFAFSDYTKSSNVAIFAYIETPEGIKGFTGGAPQITLQGPYVRTHKRHFLQQASYTLATKGTKDDHDFICHEDVFASNKTDQDILVKIIIPSSERCKALAYLDEMNINHFSLMQTDDSLMKTLAFKEIIFKNL